MGVLAVAALPVAGCAGAGSQEPAVAADCSARVRLDGRVYDEGGFTDRSASRLGVAEEAACYDVGENPPGSGFLDHPRQVTVWSFPGLAPEEVLGVRVDEETFRVFVVESLPRADADRIVRELHRAQR
jgi:hypothetical protein